MNNSAIIVAGGNGLRMGAQLPKQFLLLCGKPVLMHTLEVFHCFDHKMELILVLPQAHFDYWNSLCEVHQFTLPHQLVAGGNSRYQSVKNGLQIALGNLIAVHDGVRPLVSNEVINKCFLLAEQYGAVIPTLPVNESLRLIAAGQSTPVDRSLYLTVQTPQVFQAQLLNRAYNEVEQGATFTDDASLVQVLGSSIYCVDGNRENIKITYLEDLQYAEYLLALRD